MWEDNFLGSSVPGAASVAAFGQKGAKGLNFQAAPSRPPTLSFLSHVYRTFSHLNLTS
jgi:hypothetical protein